MKIVFVVGLPPRWGLDNPYYRALIKGGASMWLGSFYEIKNNTPLSKVVAKK